jgi:hypothetical protein
VLLYNTCISEYHVAVAVARATTALDAVQRYTIFFITVSALHVSGIFSAHHQELKTVHTGPLSEGLDYCCV